MDVIVTWYSHAVVLIESAGTRLLIDPFFNGNPLSPISEDQIEADYIFVSHGHGDHVGDTGLFYDMALIGDEGIDLAILPIGDNYTMGPEDSLRAVKLIKPRQVLPIHYDTFEVIKQDPDIWKSLVEQETEAKVLLLKPGESISLS